MVDLQGVAFALLAAFGWGTYFVPVKKVGLDKIFQLQGGTGIGALAFAGAILPFYGTATLDIHGIIAGIIWVAASVMMLLSVRQIGLARASPLDGGLVMVSSFLWGLLYFNEQLSSLVMAVIGLALLVAGMPLIAVGEKKDGSRKGYALAVGAGLLWGSIFVPLKLASTLESTYFSMTLTICVLGVALMLVSRQMAAKRVVVGVAAGVMWNVSNLASFAAIASLGLAIGYPLTQIAILVAALWGLLYFKEVNRRRSMAAIYAGASVILAGSVFLALSSA